MGLVYLLGCTRWQQLDCVLFVTRDTTREKDGILLRVVVKEGGQIFDLLYRKRVLGASFGVSVLPRS